MDAEDIIEQWEMKNVDAEAPNIENEDEEEEDGKVIPFLSVVPGGKEPPKGNWLKHLKQETVFLARRRNEP